MSNRLRALLGSNFIVLLVKEERKRHDKQTQHSIQAIQSIINHLQLEKDIIHSIRCSPVLLRAQLSVRRGGGQGDVDGHEQDGGQQGEDGDEAYDGHASAAFGGFLVDEDEDAGDEEEDGECDGVGDPY